MAANSKLPKYRRHSLRDRAFIQVDGKRRYLPGPYKSPESLRAYRDHLQSIKPCLDAPSKATITVAVLAGKFQTWADVNYPPTGRSERSNVQAALKPLVALHGSLPAASITPSHLKAIQQHLAALGLTRGYINATCARIKRAFRWAAAEELIPPAVPQALWMVPWLRAGRSTAKESRPRCPVTLEQVAAVLPELSPTVATMVRLQWLTGARSQSICQARAHQFDTSKSPWEWRPIHKTQSRGHDLVIYLGPQAQEILKPLLLDAAPAEYLFSPKHSLTGRPAKGYRSFYDSVSYLRAIRRAQDRVNAQRAEAGLDPLPRWTPHQIRHARATAVRAKYGLEAAQATLGHQTLSAAQIYAARLDAAAREIATAEG